MGENLCAPIEDRGISENLCLWQTSSKITHTLNGSTGWETIVSLWMYVPCKNIQDLAVVSRHNLIYSSFAEYFYF